MYTYLSSPVLGGAFGRRELAPALALLVHGIGALACTHLVGLAGNGRINGVLLRATVGMLLDGGLLLGRRLSCAGSEQMFPEAFLAAVSNAARATE